GPDGALHRRRRASLEPLYDVTDAGKDDDDVEATVAREDALEDRDELGRAHPGLPDVPHVDPTSLDRSQRVLAIQEPLRGVGPVGGLVEEIALDRAAAGHQDAVDAGLLTRGLVAPLAVGIHLEANDALELGKDLGVGVQSQARTRRPDVVRAVAEAPARHE